MGQGRESLCGVATPSPPLQSRAPGPPSPSPVLLLLVLQLLLPGWMAAARVGAPAALPVSDRPQGTDGEAWEPPLRGGLPPVCWESLRRGAAADVAGRRHLPGRLGTPRGAPSPPRRPRSPQRAAPARGEPHPASRLHHSSGAAAVTWVPLSRERKLKQERKESRLSSKGGRGAGTRYSPCGPGLPAQGHQPRSSIPPPGGSASPHPQDSHFPCVFLAPVTHAATFSTPVPPPNLSPGGSCPTG